MLYTFFFMCYTFKVIVENETLKDFEIGRLIDVYGELLTPRQKEMLRQYYDLDYSLKEIAENFSVSRQAVHDTVTKGAAALKDYESRLGFYNKIKSVNRLIDEEADCTGGILEKIREVINE